MGDSSGEEAEAGPAPGSGLWAAGSWGVAA